MSVPAPFVKKGIEGLVGRGRALAQPHAVVHGKLSDPWFVVYKPPSLRIEGGMGGDSLASRISAKTSLYFPLPLAAEEEGLQVVTRHHSINKMLTLGHSLGVVKFGYSALLNTPHCFPTSCEREGTLQTQFANLQKTREMTLNAQDFYHTASTTPKANKKIDALFDSPALALAPQQHCVGCSCKKELPDVRTTKPFSSHNVSLKCSVWDLFEVDVSQKVQGFCGETVQNIMAMNINTRGSTEDVRKMLAYGAFPIFRDVEHNEKYREERRHLAVAHPDKLLSENSLLHEHHANESIVEPFQIGMGLARSAISFPEPTKESSAYLHKHYSALRDVTNPHHSIANTNNDVLAAANTALSHVAISVPRPPAWENYKSGDIIKKSAAFAVEGVLVHTTVGTGVVGSDEAEVTVVAQKRKVKGGEKRSENVCLRCYSKTHTVEHCPELNGVSQKQSLRASVAKIASLPGTGVYCEVCASTEHEALSCSRRKRGVDPATHCAVCGSFYHKVLECPEAEAAGLGSLDKANEYAASIGFPDYGAYKKYMLAMQRTTSVGLRPSYYCENVDGGRVSTDELSSTDPSELLYRSTDGHQSLRVLAKQRKQRGRNLGTQRFQQKYAEKEAATLLRNEEADKTGGVNWGDYERV